LGPSVGSIRFFPDGSSTGGGVLLESDQAGYDVLVDWLTGGISIHERVQMHR
jgi:general secretion pathway protein H